MKTKNVGMTCPVCRGIGYDSCQRCLGAGRLPAYVVSTDPVASPLPTEKHKNPNR